LALACAPSALSLDSQLLCFAKEELFVRRYRCRRSARRHAVQRDQGTAELNDIDPATRSLCLHHVLERITDQRVNRGVALLPGSSQPGHEQPKTRCLNFPHGRQRGARSGTLTEIAHAIALLGTKATRDCSLLAR